MNLFPPRRVQILVAIRETSVYCYIWSFRVRPENVPAFRDAYGPDGGWVRFFRRDPEYRGTQLLCDREDPTRFLTIDFWSSQEAWSSFHGRFAKQFESLDSQFETLTVEETHVGSFELAKRDATVI